MRILLQSSFVLHQRPYRETSVLLDIFSYDYGRLSLMARGVRQQRSAWRGLLQPFFPLLLSWQGKTELMNLTAAETHANLVRLSGECLLIGFYLNELLMRLLHKHDPHPALFTLYHHTLISLQQEPFSQKTLRYFEKKLLDELGYGLGLSDDIQAEAYYEFHPQHGLIRQDAPMPEKNFSGKNLLAFFHEKLDDEHSLREAKRLTRLALSPLLGEKPLHSKKLFME